jgi:hypothetical protein
VFEIFGEYFLGEAILVEHIKAHSIDGPLHNRPLLLILT